MQAFVASILMVIAMAFAVGCSDETTFVDQLPSNTQEPSTEDQLAPLKVGNDWTYIVTIANPDSTLGDPFDSTEAIVSKEPLPAKFENVEYGDLWYYAMTDSTGFAANDTAIFRARMNEDGDGILLFQSLPDAFQPGFTETFRVEFGQDSVVVYNWSEELFNITTVFGTFIDCRRVRYNNVYEYWRQGVGLVYQVDSADGVVFFRKELKSINFR